MRKSSVLFALWLLVACATTGNIEKTTGNSYINRSDGSLSWALDRLDQRTLPLDNKLKHRNSGQGVNIYVFDSGISENHPEFKGRVKKGFNSDSFPCNSHGTSVAGAAAGNNFGVAIQANIIDIKIFNCADEFESSDKFLDRLELAVDWVIADVLLNKQPAIANWSFSFDNKVDTTRLFLLTEKLFAHNISVVASAGNVDMNACERVPAKFPNVIVVSGTYIEVDSIQGALLYKSDFKNKAAAWGDCVDLYAPGDDIWLASIDGMGNMFYQKWAGTSMSAGFVSGIVALYLQDFPLATPQEISDQLKCFATKDIIKDTHETKTNMVYLGNFQTRCELTGKLPPSEGGHHEGSNPFISTWKKFRKWFSHDS